MIYLALALGIIVPSGQRQYDGELYEAARLLKFNETRRLLSLGASARATRPGRPESGSALFWIAGLNLNPDEGQRKSAAADMTTLLLDHGADSNEIRTPYNTKTPLICAAAASVNVEVGAVLLERGADPNSAIQHPGSEYPFVPALFLAVSYVLGYREPEEQVAFVDMLLKAGADPNACGTRQMTLPLNFAAYDGRSDLVRLLVVRRASIDARQEATRTTPYRYTALHSACLRNTKENAEVVRLLLQHGADARIRDELGRTALDIARDKGFDLIERALTDKH